MDSQAVADNVEKRCQRQHAAALAAAQSQIELIQHACWSYQLQLKDAEDTCKEFESEAQRALDSLAGQARAREDELQQRHQSWLSVKALTPAHPARGDLSAEPDQELQEVLLELESTKIDFAIARQDITNLEIEKQHRQDRAEVAEKRLPLLDRKGNQRAGSLGPSDDETQPFF